MFRCQQWASSGPRSVRAAAELLLKNGAKSESKIAVRHGSGHGYVQVFKTPTLSDLPAPSGSWAEFNSQRQKKYNLQLLAGVASVVFTFFAGKSLGIFYLNPGPELKKVVPEVLTYSQVEAARAAAASSANQAAVEAEAEVAQESAETTSD